VVLQRNTKSLGLFWQAAGLHRCRGREKLLDETTPSPTTGSAIVPGTPEAGAEARPPICKWRTHRQEKQAQTVVCSGSSKLVPGFAAGCFSVDLPGLGLPCWAVKPLQIFWECCRNRTASWELLLDGFASTGGPIADHQPVGPMGQLGLRLSYRWRARPPHPGLPQSAPTAAVLRAADPAGLRVRNCSIHRQRHLPQECRSLVEKGSSHGPCGPRPPRERRGWASRQLSRSRQRDGAAWCGDGAWQQAPYGRQADATPHRRHRMAKVRPPGRLAPPSAAGRTNGKGPPPNTVCHPVCSMASNPCPASPLPAPKAFFGGSRCSA